MTEEIKHDKCTRCKSWRLPSAFLNEAGRKLKTCSSCRTKQVNYTANNKCIHDRDRAKSRCKECNPIGHIKQVMYDLVRRKLGLYYNPSITREAYMGISSDGFLKYVNSKLKDRMTWDNHGLEWSIVYIPTPDTYILSDDLTQEQIYNITNYKNIDVWSCVHPLSKSYIPLCIHGDVEDNCVPCDGKNICICGKVFDKCSSCNEK